MPTAESKHSSQPQKRRRSFDSLTFAKRLQAGGVFTREQAGVLAEEQAALIDERLATKEDIEALRLSTKADIAAVNANIETTAERTKAEILKWIATGWLLMIPILSGRWQRPRILCIATATRCMFWPDDSIRLDRRAGRLDPA